MTASSTFRPVGAPRVLTQRHLNRALLVRQLLVERQRIGLVEAVEQIGGMQTQYAPSGYVGLWTRLAGFERGALTAALESRAIVQATLLRTTIHMVSAREFWRYAVGVRRARREWAARVGGLPAESELQQRAEALRHALADGPKSVKELEGLAGGFIGNLGLWVDLVRVPPSGTWQRRRADRLALADQWVGPEDADEEEGLAHLVRSYLRAFGPAPWRDIAGWAGIPVGEAKRGGEELTLVHYRDERGMDLVDLAGTDLPDPDLPVPPRFLAHWDNAILVHARRTGLLPEAHRARIFSIRNPFSVGTVLVDGRVVAGWSLRAGRIELEWHEEIPARDARTVEREREALEGFHA